MEKTGTRCNDKKRERTARRTKSLLFSLSPLIRTFELFQFPHPLHDRRMRVIKGRIQRMGMEIGQIFSRQFYEGRCHSSRVTRQVDCKPVGLALVPPRKIAEERRKRKSDERTQKSHDKHPGKERCLLQAEQAGKSVPAEQVVGDEQA